MIFRVIFDPTFSASPSMKAQFVIKLVPYENEVLFTRTSSLKTSHILMIILSVRLNSRPSSAVSMKIRALKTKNCVCFVVTGQVSLKSLRRSNAVCCSERRETYVREA